MYYKIKKDKRSGCFVVTRNRYKNDPFKFKIQAERILQFGSAILVQHAKNSYSLYLLSSQVAIDFPTLIMENISQYRVFRNSSGHSNRILALNIENYWTFLIPEDFRYFIHLNEVLDGRKKTLPKLKVMDSTLPAYFKKGFEDTLVFIFHANEQDYIISHKNFDMTGVEAQIKVTEFSVITPLPPKCCFEATDGTNQYLYWNSCLQGTYPVLESFAEEEDYPEEFKGQHNYCGKDVEGNILGLFIFNSFGNLKCCIESEKPMKSVHFYKRVYTSANFGYFDIWQITYANGQKQMLIKADGFHNYGTISIDSDAWNF